MTPDQVKIAEWLKLEVPTLHPAFTKAVEFMGGADFPGRSNLVCHCCRDICTVIQQHYRVERDDRADPTALLSKLETLWERNKLDELTRPAASIPGSAEPSKLPADSPVPREVIQMVQSVLQEHRRGTVNQRDQALSMFLEIAPEAAGRPDLYDTHAEQWKGLRRWFIEYAHFTLKQKVCDEGELRARFLLLETHLLTMVSTFYEGVEELDKILVQEPTYNTVARAIALMSRPEQQRYFFARLENPGWIEPLKKKGMFNKLPVPGRDADKGTSWVNDWPVGRYLSRMAEGEGAAVAEIFGALPPTDNPYVVSALLDAALVMPASLVARLAPKIAKAVGTPFWLPADKMGRIAVNLASGGEHKGAFQILNSLLRVIPDPRAPLDPDKAWRSRREAIPTLPAFDYSTILHVRGKDLATYLGLPYLSMLCRLLQTAIGEEITFDQSSSRKTEDYSSVWKARLESSSFHESAKHLLVPAVLCAAETLCEAGASTISEVIATIRKYQFKVYDRIAFRILAKRVERAPSLAVQLLLYKERFLDGGVRQEYDALAGATFKHLSPAEQDTYLGWIDEGLDRKRLEGVGYGQGDVDAAIEHWRFQRLSPLKSLLPEDRSIEFTAMEEKFGEAKSYANPIAQGGAYALSEKSPMDGTTLGAMEPRQVIEHLRSWEPTANDPFPFGYSKEGLGTVFAGVVADAPRLYIAHLEQIKDLDPIYIGSAIHGFDNAIRSDKGFDVGAVLALALWIAEQPATKFANPSAESDSDFSGAKHNVIDLVQEGLKHQKLPPSEQGTIWKIIDLLSEDQWGTLDYRNPKAHTKDAWFHSLNYLRPKAVRAAFQYLQWSMKNAGQTTFAFSNTPELANYFNRHSNPSQEVCLSVRLIFGELFPYLHALDPAWGAVSANRIFPDTAEHQALRDVAWAAYLAANQAYDNVFALLEPQYRSAITFSDEQRLLGKSNLLENASGMMSWHLLQQYWRGKISLAPDTLLSDFFLLADERGRRSAIIYVGRSLRETTDEVQDEIIQRLMALWDNRLEAAAAGGASGEMRAFSWWFFTRFFDDEWALKSLHAALKVSGGHLDLIMDSLGRLSSLADKYPATVVECTQMIVGASPDYVELWSPDIIRILELALRSSDIVAAAAARHLIEYLGIRGHLEFRNLLTIDPAATDAT
jgi:hypothetical protein